MGYWIIYTHTDTYSIREENMRISCKHEFFMKDLEGAKMNKALYYLCFLTSS